MCYQNDSDMKQISMVFFLVIMQLTGLSQIDGLYRFQQASDFKGHTSLYIVFQEGRYAITFINNNSPSEIVDDCDISFGHYVVKHRRITLCDDVLGIEIVLKKKLNGELRVVNGFYPLRGMVFKKEKVNFNESIEDYREISKAQYEADIYRYQNQVFNVDVSLGSYVCGSTFFNGLVFLPDQRYKYYCRDFLVSAGKWERRGNLIVLLDYGGTKPFYAFKKKEGIDGKYLPGAYSDCLMTYIYDYEFP